MANQTKRTASTRKPAAGKTATTKSKSNSKPARKTAAKSDLDRRWGILLFGIGAFLLLLAVIPGDLESGWAWMRQNILFGGFGVSGWLLGAMVIYWAVLVSMAKPLFSRVVRGSVFLVALSAFALVFGKVDIEGLGFVEVLKALQVEGGQHWFSGGLLSVLLGGTLLALIGRTAACAVMLLLIVLAVMLFTGVTPGDVVRFIGDKWAARPQRERPPRQPRPQREEAPVYEASAQPRAAVPAGRRGRQQAAARPMPPLMPPQRRRSLDVDIDLGPDHVLSQPGGSGMEHEVDIGPGGTFGLNPLEETRPVANADDVGFDGPILPFEKVQVEDAFAKPDNNKTLLFGRDDPFSVIGGVDSKLPQGALPDIEYIAPPADQAFDLFGQPVNGEHTGLAPAADPAQVPPPQVPIAPAPAADPLATEAGFAGAVSAAPVAAVAASAPPQAAAVVDDDAPPFDVEPQETPAGGIDSHVNRLIEKAAEKKESAEPAGGAFIQDIPESQSYQFPPLELFAPPPPESDEGAREEMKRTAERLVAALESFKVKTSILDVSRGPTVTRYEVQPMRGVKISQIKNLSDDIALNLAAKSVRIQAPIPGKQAVGIEVPNEIKSTVGIRSILESRAFSAEGSPLALALGKDIAGDAVVADLTRMPHLLIAGSTGSGKSVCVNSIIMSFLYKSGPEDVRLLLIDPKMVELAEYNGIPHLLMPVVTEPRKAAGALGSAVAEMERRYKLFAENQVRDIKSFNKSAPRLGFEPLPYIAIVIDELADLMMTSGKEVEDYICRIAQKARAAGMHLIVATQRPSVDVITGLIKANIPSRIAFAVSSQVDSRTILDSQGAEKLLGMGDMLFMPVGANEPVRVQGTFVKDKEIHEVLDFIKASSDAEYDEDMIKEMERRAAADTPDTDGGDNKALGDPLFIEVGEFAIEQGQVSTSGIQRRFSLGYARAGRIVDELERRGVVGPPNGAKPREVLMSRVDWLEMFINGVDAEEEAEDGV